ncbi:MAG: copper amine oxidase N-terminal domain-containing protein [Filifactoraceae bacterium]
MKKKLSLLLAGLLVMTLVPVSSFAYKTTESSPFTVDYGKKGADAKKSYVISVDMQNDTLASDSIIRLDLTNAKFSDVTVASVEKPAKFEVEKSGSLATIKNTSAVELNAKFDIKLSIDTEDSDSGDVLLAIDNSVLGKASYKIGAVKEEASKSLNVVVEKSDKVVSLSGGALSKFEVKNFNKEKELVIKLDGDNAVLDKETKVNGTKIPAEDIKFSNGVITISSKYLKTKGFIVVEPMIGADRKMELGAAEIEVQNDGDTATAKIGDIVDYTVSLKVVENGKKEIPTVMGGKETTLKVTLEGPKGSITKDRAYDIELEGATVEHDASGKILNVSGTNVEVSNLKGIKAEDRTDEFTVSTSATDATKIEFTMKVRIDATAKDGVATMKVSSRDLASDLTADIAKVNRAYVIESKVTEIKRGEAAKTADVSIKESKVGQLNVGDVVEFQLNGKTAFNEKPVFEATNGLKFGKVEYKKDSNKTVVTAKVTAKSKKEVSTITLSGAAVDMLYNGIQGRVYTASIFVKGVEYGEFDYTKCVAEYTKLAPKIVFTLGSANYTVDGVVKTLEAPVFTKDSRTMLPIGPLALAMGLEVNYNADTKTASFRDAATGQVVSVKEFASSLYNNGIEYKMYTSSVTVNGRIFVPVASITDAFGVKIAWDGATQTVTIN